MRTLRLKPCPRCGKRAAELMEDESSRFPFRVKCQACGWMTPSVKLQSLAADLWNEEKPAGRATKRARSRA